MLLPKILLGAGCPGSKTAKEHKGYINVDKPKYIIVITWKNVLHFQSMSAGHYTLIRSSAHKSLPVIQSYQTEYYSIFFFTGNWNTWFPETHPPIRIGR